VLGPGHNLGMLSHRDFLSGLLMSVLQHSIRCLGGLPTVVGCACQIVLAVLVSQEHNRPSHFCGQRAAFAMKDTFVELYVGHRCVGLGISCASAVECFAGLLFLL
jgi:hypothetical protein